MPNPFILYRIFNDADELLYVGATTRVVGRISEHGREKWWWDQATKITMERFDTWEELAAMEKATIQIEGPRYNEVHLKPIPRRLERYRLKGDGSLFQRADGLWIGRVELPADPRTGKRRYKTTASKDRAIAERKLEELKAKVRADKG